MLYRDFFCGESRIRTCEVHTADLQSALVGRLSISPPIYKHQLIFSLAVANIKTVLVLPNYLSLNLQHKI